MGASWQRQLIERLASGAGVDGGWGYAPDATASAEPTAVAALALTAHGVESALCEKARRWLMRLQQPDGGVAVTPELQGPCWPTPLAALAWLCDRDGQAAETFEVATRSAIEWMLELRGVQIAPTPRIFGHDTMLQGWPWVRDTHSWVEPTGYSILALRASGRGEHPRVREAVRLLLDRALSDGGWNYGNTRVIDHVLRAFPAPSGVALAALCGEPADRRITSAVGFLSRELRRVRSPFSLGWGVIGLAAWDALPTGWEDWLAESAARAIQGRPNYLEQALLLLAGADRKVLTADRVGSLYES